MCFACEIEMFAALWMDGRALQPQRLSRLPQNVPLLFAGSRFRRSDLLDDVYMFAGTRRASDCSCNSDE